MAATTPYDFRMNTEELKELQAPLKTKYRETPDAAVITLKADGTLGDGITCSVQTGKALTAAGLHPATRRRSRSRDAAESRNAPRRGGAALRPARRVPGDALWGLLRRGPRGARCVVARRARRERTGARAHLQPAARPRRIRRRVAR